MDDAQAKEKVKELLAQYGSLEVSWSDPKISEIYPNIQKAAVRSALAREGIVCSLDVNNQIARISRFNDVGKPATKISEPAKAPEVKPQVSVAKRTKHTYIPPHFDAAVKKVLLDEVPQNIWFYGPTGSGKTEYVHHLGEQLKRPVIMINGRQDMETAGFLGDKTIEIDKDSKQNFIRFFEGPVVKAMTTGLNDKGDEDGEPAILFIDEVAALPSHILIGLNRVLENRKSRREVSLDGDGGRVVKSHSKFRIICAGNTVGRGHTGLGDALYTAQGDALDISTLNRFAATFRFGYNKQAEKSILQEKTGDDLVTKLILEFRDAIRGAIKTNKLQTPFSTRDIVAIADNYRILGSIAEAIYYGVMNRLPADEKAVYNELAVAHLKIDILAQCENTREMDYID